MIGARAGIFVAALALAAWCLGAAAGTQSPKVSVPPASQPAARETIAPADLQGMYRAELGDSYHEADAQKLAAAHELIERYFETDDAASRAKVVASLDASGVDAGALARLARLRIHWPALEGGAVFYTNERHGPYQVRYFLGVPAGYDRRRAWPLVVMLPAANAFTAEPPPTADDVVRIYTTWIKEELARHPNTLVLMPLLNLDELWGPSYAGMHSVIQPLLHVGEQANVDVSRVYLVGHGMSAHAVWNLGLHFSTYFAAINPMGGAASGDWQRLRLMNLRNVLPVVWHDQTDAIIRVGFARSLVKTLQSLKLDVVYEETRTLGHIPTPEVVERMYLSLRKRQRETRPKEVWLQSNRLDTTFNRVDWVQAYQPIEPGKEKRLIFRRGSGLMRVYERSWRVQASIVGPNHIESTTDNVATLRIYLDPGQIDFTRPVTVNVNKKVRFEGMVKPSIAEMLKDQVFLGRGWRNYTAIIDIDLAPRAATQPASRPAGR